ncbi:uncharacterized protein G2W53_032956 [Senna tora]|uniref:Uncharacterized protein n=1 Tax=Senna tora TaxID=362788 RepID=A0A834SZW2_9FABA|nr:uncharacterized protein G2W53_032956 [Senna tora]
MTMVMASTSNQTIAFYSSTSNSLVQRRDIQCNASDKGKQIKKHRDQHLRNFGMTDSELFKDLCSKGLMCLKPGKIWTTPFPAWFQADLTYTGRISLQGTIIKKMEVKGTPRAKDTKKWDPKKDYQMLKEKNMELKEKNLDLREENLQMKEENLCLRREGQRLKDEMTRMERRELELRKENETYCLQLAEKQSHMRNLMAELKALGGHVTSRKLATNGKAQVEDEPDNSKA